MCPAPWSSPAWWPARCSSWCARRRYRAHPVATFDDVEAAGFTVAAAIGGPALAALIAVGELVGSFACGAGRTSRRRPPHLRHQPRAPAWATACSTGVHATRRVPTGAVGMLAVAGGLAFVLTLEQVVSLINFGALTGFLVVSRGGDARRAGASSARARRGSGCGSSRCRRSAPAFVATLLWNLSPTALGWSAARGWRWGAVVLTFRGPSWRTLNCAGARRVSGDHFIADRRVASRTDADGDESDRRHAARRDRRGRRRRRRPRPSRPRGRAFPAWAALGPGGPRADPAAARRPHRARRRVAGPGRDHQQRVAARGRPSARDEARRRTTSASSPTSPRRWRRRSGTPRRPTPTTACATTRPVRRRSSRRGTRR